ncbi:hypothetical protein POM88_008043 [Heracleum sosnowskyi]|uniref:Uncharacterized protein n=1 Tax=Heracleum sosnowskyi TaxID=360622 RepID=A0AAD8J5H7_9APIA|nr:hypothetical protein POM88_008043 [Heracleum sosnowskyi]
MGSGFGESTILWWTAIRLHLVSTYPTTTIEILAKTSPTPIRWSCRIPVGIPVNFLSAGTQMRSYSGTAINMKISGIDSNGSFGMDVDNDEVQSINNFYGLHDNSDNSELHETWIPKCDSKVKSYVGQLFSNIDTSFDFYTNYGSLGGFTIRKSTQKKFDDKTISVKYFVCSKSGSGDDSVSCEVD